VISSPNLANTHDLLAGPIEIVLLLTGDSGARVPAETEGYAVQGELRRES
jgi:hypothetical protein